MFRMNDPFSMFLDWLLLCVDFAIGLDIICEQ